MEFCHNNQRFENEFIETKLVESIEVKKPKKK